MDNEQWLRVAKPAAPANRVMRRGMTAEVLGDGFVGQITRASTTTVELTDRRGRARTFSLDNAFVVDEQVVRLVLPRSAPSASATTASGSVAVAGVRARTARGSRIWVEGLHDAELIEQVWGDDLRVEGVVVEPLHGVDDLLDRVAEFAPGPGRRLGILLDHLVDGSKESRVAAQITDRHTLVAGHSCVDIWTAVKPARLGLDAWPSIPHGTDYKTGVARHLGFDTTRQAWDHIKGQVRTWTDLERDLIRSVELLIDFVTADGA